MHLSLKAQISSQTKDLKDPRNHFLQMKKTEKDKNPDLQSNPNQIKEPKWEERKRGNEDEDQRIEMKHRKI